MQRIHTLFVFLAVAALVGCATTAAADWPELPASPLFPAPGADPIAAPDAGPDGGAGPAAAPGGDRPRRWGSVLAEDSGADVDLAEGRSPAGEDAGAEKEKRHGVNLFLGSTMRRGDGGAFTVGVDYLYALSEHWGVGGFADVVLGHHVAAVVGPAGYWMPAKRLVFMLGPGVEFETGESEALVRVGGFYEFEVGKTLISPALYVDFINHKKTDLVLGVNFGWKF